MKSKTTDAAKVTEAVESLRREVTRLSERAAALEQILADKAREAAQYSDQTLKAESLGEDLVLVVSAAIAAYLGVKPHIRQIRLLRSKPWSQQGRVTIQASHALAVHHG